ncbi:thermonuclease family protein [Desulfoplanes sp.]
MLCSPNGYRKKRRLVHTIVLVGLIAIFWVSSVDAADWTVRVRYVPDGDTLFLATGERLRIKGIDCPETGHDDHPAQYYAGEARNYLWRLVKGRDLYVDTRSLRTDRFGRIVTPVLLPDGRSVGRVLVENGYAFCYPHGRRPGRQHRDLLAAQRRAMNGLRGMWARILRIPAAGVGYVGNKNSHRFHTRDCKYGKQIGRRNTVYFSGLRQAFYAGFAPCRSCTPWPAAR